MFDKSLKENTPWTKKAIGAVLNAVEHCGFSQARGCHMMGPGEIVTKLTYA